MAQPFSPFLPSLAHKHHQELEQVDEVQVEPECAEDGDLFGHLGAPRLGTAYPMSGSVSLRLKTDPAT
jgi:hypothetical protein